MTIARRMFREMIVILSFFMITVFPCAGSYNPDEVTTYVNDGGEKVFVIHAPIRDLNEFRVLAKQAVRLKQFGRVEINISELAENSYYEKPEGNNFWYEYASNNPTPYKFFPDPKIAPFIPAESVKKNRELLLAKAKILKEYGIDAAFWCYEPNFLPEAFYEAWPHLRGARVDHPRRNNVPAFAPCVSEKETQEMYAGMVAELLRNVPSIHTFFFKTNDAGSGICWSDWQYTGPNGPDHCKNLSMGERVADLMNAFKEGASRAGKEISIYLTGSMFSDKEKEDIYAHLPENCHFQSHNSDEVRSISSMIVSTYPVRGLFDPFSVFGNINSLAKGDAGTVFISFRASYDRGVESPEAMDKMFDMLVDYIGKPAVEGKQAEMDQLHKLCEAWAGPNSADKLFNAFLQLEDADQYKRTAVGGVSPMYWGVTARHITRPLVIKPDLLTEAEESYFLPYVFNPSLTEARMDYTDIHGAHRSIEPGMMQRYVSQLKSAATLLEEVDNQAPEIVFIRQMAKAVRIYASIMRSCGNFGEAQMIIDRNAGKLSMEAHRPNKIPTWDGDPDLQAFNAIMRDELDNTQELIDLLDDGGMNLICHAPIAEFEDSFLLGPDLKDQLKQKRKIMIAHWTDIESYLTTPFK